MRAVGSAFGGRLHAGMEPVMVLVRPDRRVRSMLMYVCVVVCWAGQLRLGVATD